jgi:predicted nucleotidyltransferase component of viral defense system
MIKDIGKSVKARLLNLAKEKKVDYQVLIIRYLYERLLYRLSVSDYKEKFYLKGGALLYALAKELPRPTLDIDFLGVQLNSDSEHIKMVFMEICQMPCSDGVLFDTETITTESITEGKTYTGIRVSLLAHLDSIKQVLKIDIGFGDIVKPSPQLLFYPTLIGSFPSPSILAYSLEAVVAEKFQAMIELADLNSRYKDFYDVYRILLHENLSNETLSEAILATFRNRGTVYYTNHPLFSQEFANNEERNRQWRHFLKKIKQDETLEFNTVMALIRARLESVYEQIVS